MTKHSEKHPDERRAKSLDFRDPEVRTSQGGDEMEKHAIFPVILARLPSY